MAASSSTFLSDTSLVNPLGSILHSTLCSDSLYQASPDFLSYLYLISLTFDPIIHFLTLGFVPECFFSLPFVTPPPPLPYSDPYTFLSNQFLPCPSFRALYLLSASVASFLAFHPFFLRSGLALWPWGSFFSIFSLVFGDMTLMHSLVSCNVLFLYPWTRSSHSPRSVKTLPFSDSPFQFFSVLFSFPLTFNASRNCLLPSPPPV